MDKELIKELKEVIAIYDEHPSRSLIIANLPHDADIIELTRIIKQYGEVKSIYTKTLLHHFIIVTFYDLRSSRSTQKYLNERMYYGYKLEIKYCIDIEPSLLMVKSNLSIKQLKDLFSMYGEIKDLHEMNKIKYLEYFDSRNTSRIIKEVHESLTSIEIEYTTSLYNFDVLKKGLQVLSLPLDVLPYPSLVVL